MSKHLDTERKYYTTRACKLADDEYYSTMKNQTFQQNSFYVYSVPRSIIRASYDTGSTQIEFDGTFVLGTAAGAFFLYAGDADGIYLDGTFVWSFNGTAQGSKTSNPAEVRHGDLTGSAVAGLNYLSGTFVAATGSVYSVGISWMNSWEAP